MNNLRKSIKYIMDKNTKSVNSFIGDNGVNHYLQCVDEIAILIENYYKKKEEKISKTTKWTMFMDIVDVGKTGNILNYELLCTRIEYNKFLGVKLGIKNITFDIHHDE